MAVTRAGTAVAFARDRDTVDFEVWGGGLDDCATVVGGVAQADDSGHSVSGKRWWRANAIVRLTPGAHDYAAFSVDLRRAVFERYLSDTAGIGDDRADRAAARQAQGRDGGAETVRPLNVDNGLARVDGDFHDARERAFSAIVIDGFQLESQRIPGALRRAYDTPPPARLPSAANASALAACGVCSVLASVHTVAVLQVGRSPLTRCHSDG